MVSRRDAVKKTRLLKKKLSLCGQRNLCCHEHKMQSSPQVVLLHLVTLINPLVRNLTLLAAKTPRNRTCERSLALPR